MYQIRSSKAAQIAETMNDPQGGLAANGLKVTAEGDRISFGEDVLSYFREHSRDVDDYHIADVDGVPTMFIAGDDYEITTQS